VDVPENLNACCSDSHLAETDKENPQAGPLRNELRGCARKAFGKPHASCRMRFKEDESMRVLLASAFTFVLAWQITSPVVADNGRVSLGVSLGHPQALSVASSPQIQLTGFSAPVATAAKPVAYEQNAAASNYPSPLPSWGMAPEPAPAPRGGTFAV